MVLMNNGPMFNELMVIPMIGSNIIETGPCQQYLEGTMDEGYS
jgi:hypothetical protein